MNRRIILLIFLLFIQAIPAISEEQGPIRDEKAKGSSSRQGCDYS